MDFFGYACQDITVCSGAFNFFLFFSVLNGLSFEICFIISGLLFREIFSIKVKKIVAALGLKNKKYDRRSNFLIFCQINSFLVIFSPLSMHGNQIRKKIPLKTCRNNFLKIDPKMPFFLPWSACKKKILIDAIPSL
jgi:hypothetical protein